MNYYADTRKLDLSLIDCTDFSYSISPDREIAPDVRLTESIARHGILHPPIVKETARDMYVVVTGRKRLSIFRSIFPEKKSCTCFIVQTNTPEIKIFSILLEELLIRREPSPIERAIFLQKISLLEDATSIAKELVHRLKLPPDPIHIRQNIHLLDLEEPLILAIHRGILHEKTATELLPLTGQDRLSFLQIITSLQPSTSYQKKMIYICRELANRENRAVAEILADHEVQEIINHRNANPPQKMKNLMNYLSGKHMPRSRHAEEEFNQFSAALKLPENVSMLHTPFFEDDSVTLSINFSDRESLKNTWETIRDAIGNQDN